MWTLLLLTVTALSPPTVEVQPLTGEAISGTLAELGAEQIAIETSQGRVSLEMDRLKTLSLNAPGTESRPAGSVWVELIDGSSLVASDYLAKDGQARIALAGGKMVEVPILRIRWVRLQGHSEATAAEWSKILQTTPGGDLLVARGEDSIDSHQGVLREVTDSVVKFELDGELLPVKRSKVYGLVYFRPKVSELPGAICRVTDASGSCWSARTIALNGGQLQWSTPAGVSVARPLAEVTHVDFSQGRIVYLADLKPESCTWTPYFGTAKDLPVRTEFFSPRSDRSLSPGPIELNGKSQPKGLALHSRSHLVYRLPDKFRRFQALVGIDDRVRPHGHVRLLIQGDERTLWEGTVAGTEPARALDLDLSGVRRLSILVDFGENLDVADHLDLAEARIVK